MASFSKLSSPANPFPSPGGLSFPAVITQCNFEDNSKPFCDWTQASTDDGDWTRASGTSHTGNTRRPGGYPNGGKEA